MYSELLNFEMEVTKILETKSYDLTNEKKVLVIKNWIDREGLQLILRTFKNEDKEKCKTVKELFS